ncbi:DUF4376 domain-containing protein [Chromobacterium vaccinii]|nr:DUF4376 domain-containing protein [Chromobacterium vaccinii]QND91743.1 DUF4376 domain-containing protein [Chromobacterium vaccinii]
MKAYFSPAALGFYLSDVCPKSAMPPDCVESSYEAYRAMVLTPIPAGFELAADGAGNPILREVPPPSVDELRAASAERINAVRDRLEAGGFEYRGVVIDSDSRSVERINTAAMSALIARAAGQSFVVDWKAASNASIRLDIDGVLGMQAALQAWVQYLHGEADKRKMEISKADAAKLEEIESRAWK